MKSLLLTLLLLTAATPLLAQPGPAPSGVIVGTVLEASTQTPVPSATVSVWSGRDSTLVTGTITDEAGRFQIEGLRPGAYELRVSFVGFRTQRQPVEITPTAPRVQAGTIAMHEDAALLADVEVAAEREAMEVAIDRTIYNTKDQIVASGGNATDLLRNIPSVEVDSEGKVSLRGNQNVAILINGKPAPVPAEFIATFLQQLPSGNVERIEVIPNPSAKYEPDGMAGMLNIVMKQNTSIATNGTIMAGGVSNGSYNASANINANPGKWLLSSTYGFRRDARQFGGDMIRSTLSSSTTTLNQVDESEMGMWSHTLNGSADYKLSDQNSLYATAMAALRTGSRDGLSSSTEPDFRTSRMTESEQDAFTMDYSAGFRRVVTPSLHELTAELRYNRSRNDDLQHFADRRFDGQDALLHLRQTRDDKDNLNEEASFQFDYTRPLPGEVKLETGFKSTLRWLTDDLARDTLAGSAYVNVPARSTDFAYDDQVHAAYATLGTQKGKWGVQAGLRLEQALLAFSVSSLPETFERDYFSYYPSFFLTYSLTQAQQLKASYSKRVNRPPTFLLSPVLMEMDDKMSRRGNPDLKPEYTHAMELSYTAFGQGRTFTLTPFFRRTIDPLRPKFEGTALTGLFTQTVTNADQSDSYGAEAIGTLRLGQKVNLMANTSVYRMVTEAGSSIESSLGGDMIAWTARLNGSFNLRKGTDLQATVFYRSPMKFEQFRNEGLLITDFALRQALGEKLSLNLRVSDPLDMARMHYYGELASNDLFQEGNRYWGQRQLSATLTWNFGQQGPRPPRRPQPQQQPQPDTGGFGF